MRILAVFVWLFLATATGYALFHVTFQVQALEARLSSLNKRILTEQEAVHVLKAEWSYLNRPARVARLVDDLLPSMDELRAAQIVHWREIPVRLEPDMIPGTVRASAEAR